MVKLSRTFVIQIVALSFIVSFLVQYGNVTRTLYRIDDDSNTIFINGDANLTNTLSDYYFSYTCTYDTPVYLIHERGDTSKFILDSYFILWTLFKEHLEHDNRTHVVFTSHTSFFTPSPCQHLDHSKFTNQRNDFDHPLTTLIVPTLRQSFVAFPFFFQPPLYIEKELPPYDTSFHLNSIHPVLFEKEVFQMFTNISRASRSFVATDSLPVLRTVQLSFKNVTNYSFKRRRWGTRNYQHMDYLLDLQSLGDSWLMVGKCSSTFFNVAFLYQRDYHFPRAKKVLCIDTCNEDETTLWLNNNRC